MNEPVKATINELAKQIHENALARGWWDKDRPFPEIIALCHSELSEALEEYRNGHPGEWYVCEEAVGAGNSDTACKPGCAKHNMPCRWRNPKPEGVAVELADCIVRILDYAAHKGWDMEGVIWRKDAVQRIPPLPSRREGVLTMDFIKSELRKARTPHKCHICGKEIAPGERYCHEAGRYEGSFFYHVTCLTCIKIRHEYLDGGTEYDVEDIEEYVAGIFCYSCEKYYGANDCFMNPLVCEKVRKAYQPKDKETVADDVPCKEQCPVC